MDTLRTLMIGVLVGAPLVAWGLSWLEAWLSRRALQIGVGLAALFSLLSVWGLRLAAPDGEAVSWPILSWLRMPGFEVILGMRLDGLAAMQVTLTAIVLLLVLSAWPRNVSWLGLASRWRMSPTTWANCFWGGPYRLGPVQSWRVNLIGMMEKRRCSGRCGWCSEFPMSSC